MRLREAISKANDLRPNDIRDEVKASWLYEMEAEIAELMSVDEPQNAWPEDAEMLMPSPHDVCYVYYLAACIDSFNQDVTLYQNDMEIANASKAAAMAWWRRGNNPAKGKIVRTGL